MWKVCDLAPLVKKPPKSLFLVGPVVRTLADPITRRKLSDQSMELLPREQQTPEALQSFHKAEIEKWWPIIKAAGIKGE